MTPDNSDAGLPDGKGLPIPYDYCYEWDGPWGKRKFSDAPHNGVRCNRSVPIYTADQMEAYATARVAASQAEIARLTKALESCLPFLPPYSRERAEADAALNPPPAAGDRPKEPQ